MCLTDPCPGAWDAEERLIIKELETPHSASLASSTLTPSLFWVPCSAFLETLPLTLTDLQQKVTQQWTSVLCSLTTFKFQALWEFELVEVGALLVPITQMGRLKLSKTWEALTCPYYPPASAQAGPCSGKGWAPCPAAVRTWYEGYWGIVLQTPKYTQVHLSAVTVIQKYNDSR